MGRGALRRPSFLLQAASKAESGSKACPSEAGGQATAFEPRLTLT